MFRASAGKIVAVDIAKGIWEIDDDEISACDRLEKGYHNAQIWIVKVGSQYVRRFATSGNAKLSFDIP